MPTDSGAGGVSVRTISRGGVQFDLYFTDATRQTLDYVTKTVGGVTWKREVTTSGAQVTFGAWVKQ